MATLAAALKTALPLALVALLLAPAALAPVSHRVDLAVTRAALAAFGDHVAEPSPRHARQRDRLRAAHAGTTHREYAARTLLYAALAAAAGCVLGVYATGVTITLVGAGVDAARDAVGGAFPPAVAAVGDADFGPLALFAPLALSAAVVGAGAGVGAYYLRWLLLDQRSTARAGQVRATLPRTVAFVYALSRSGMSFPDVLETLTDNEDVYGEAARELGVAVREMNNFGTDVLTAVRRTSERTPDGSMAEFGENLAAVLGSGRSLAGFLEGQYERFQAEAESQQEQYLELLEAFAEAYVTVLVAGPLFLVTILVVVGLVLEDTLDLVRVVVYVAVPLATFGFAVYVDSITRAADEGDAAGTAADPRQLYAPSTPSATDARADGGAAGASRTADRERLAAYATVERVRSWATRPVETVLARPAATFLLTVPLGIGWLPFRTGTLPFAPLPPARTLDGPLVEATLFALVGYGLAYETDKRRTRAVERAVPDFLDRMASVNDAGATVVGSVRRLTRSDLGRLGPEVERTWRDIEWGADAATALRRMGARVDSPMVSRAVALITNAMAASGEVAPVLEIAADEARDTRRLRRERRQVMVTYLLVIYVSFLVFLGIIAALAVSFVPAVQSAGAAGGGGLPPGTGVSSSVLGGLRGTNADRYALVFYHASAIQAVCSGLVAGQLGEGSVSDGVKHAAVMLLGAYVTFVFIG